MSPRLARRADDARASSTTLAVTDNERVPPTFEDICDLREEWEATLPHDEYRRRVLAQVDAMQVGEPGRAELLECLASDLDEPVTERTLELARAAVEDGGPTTIDARVEVVRALYALEREDEAGDLVRELMRARPRDDVTAGLHHSVGEALEMLARFRDAQRAYTVGLREFDPERDEPDFDEELCLAGRYRTRRALELGTDAFDRCFEEISPEGAAAIRDRAAAGTLA
jgi:hypothetical protein